ncbi:hypothetical protein Rsub_12437 [Raphidocelis subcapitata]|uniref:Fe2OG dioxygenase domain-containing protein n=1 Tax=Raphidocelis subcapitata TaxID=307507 RepID=A0A2V0PIU0_9CHLO|nr:hypothetical protein Rsub_12437 [Raphidocelis subcapitata]|eukprot:GBF99724.1 hypothetical protein Rsub_12437 [Raphidocelis subcapitata]
MLPRAAAPLLLPLLRCSRGAAASATATAAAAAAAAQCARLSTAPPVVDWARLAQAAINPSVAARLESTGFAVVDGALPPDLCAALRGEIDALRAADGAMRPNHTHLVTPGGAGGGEGGLQLLAKAGIWEAEMDADSSLGVLLSLFLPRLRLDGRGIKAQLNEGGGGAFPMHTDSEEGLDGRRVTAIYYLNESWSPGDGGELRLYPFPVAPPVDVAPLAGRLVLFSSTQMHHRVLPSRARRYCFTNWLSESRARRAAPSPQPPPPPPQPPQPQPAPPSGPASAAGAASAASAAGAGSAAGAAPGAAPDGGAEVRRFLLHPAVRRHVVKLAYAEEWERSLRESHPPGPALDAAVAAHRGGADKARRALAPYAAEVEALAAAAAAGGGGALPPDAAVRWF